MTSEGAARTVPIFLPSCTNFIIEYAGDFVHQTTGVVDNWYGDPTVAPVIPKTDGEIDYILNTVTGERKVRWFGFPRWVSGKPVSKFERSLPTPKANYATTGVPMAVDAEYLCAWGPDNLSEPKPSMIRVTFTLDDPNGALAEPPTYEYVFKVK